MLLNLTSIDNFENTWLLLVFCDITCYFTLRQGVIHIRHMQNFPKNFFRISFLIFFDLKFKTMFSKITTSLSYNCISVFIIIKFLSVFCNLIFVKVLMISCFQTLVKVLLPVMSKEYNHIKRD